MNYGVKEIAELFPHLVEIKDESLRKKVAAVWNEAITTGCGAKGWTFDELRAVKFTLLAGDIDMAFVEHLNSCARQCIAIADVLEKSFRCGIPIQRDHLIPGAVLHIIATHSHEGDKVERSIESIIFHHADFVDFDIAKFLGKRAAKKYIPPFRAQNCMASDALALQTNRP